jgi:hypothetical protein
VAARDAAEAIRAARRQAPPLPPPDLSPPDLVAALPAQGPALAARATDAVLRAVGDRGGRLSWMTFEPLMRAMARGEIPPEGFAAKLGDVMARIEAGDVKPGKGGAYLTTAWGELLGGLGLSWADLAGGRARRGPAGVPGKIPRRPLAEASSAR